MTEPTLTLTAREFRDLVTPVIPMAHKDRMIPILNAVRIESVGNYLIASATDRFAIGMSRHAPSEKPPKGLAIMIPLPSLRLILATFKPSRDVDPQLEFIVTAKGERLRLNQTGGAFDFFEASITYPLEQGEWPGLPKIITNQADSDETPTKVIGLNASLLAKFQGAVRGGEPIEITIGANNRPILITAGDHFIGALMPTLLSNSDAGTSTVSEWSALLDSAPKSKAA